MKSESKKAHTQKSCSDFRKVCRTRLGDLGVQLASQTALDKVLEIRVGQRLPQRLVAILGERVQILAQRAREHERVLRNDAQLAPQRVHADRLRGGGRAAE